MSVFNLPDLGEGLTEAEIVSWRVTPGDVVQIDQVIAEVETAKAIVEVPVPFAGTVTELHGDAGATLAVGTPLITVDETRTEGFQEPGVVTASADEGSGNVLIGYGTASAGTRRRRRGRARASVAETRLSKVHSGRIAVASPLVRRMAREAGIELREVIGSGPDGLIVRADVERAIKAHAQPEPVAAPSEEIRRIPLRGLRKTVADKLSRSRREIPEATVWVDVDATALLDIRATLNAVSTEPKIGLLALLARFAVLGLRRYPELNARIVRRRDPARRRRAHHQASSGTAEGSLQEIRRDLPLCLLFGEAGLVNMGSEPLSPDEQTLFGHQLHGLQRGGVTVVFAELVMDFPHGRHSQGPDNGKNIEFGVGWKGHWRSVATRRSHLNQPYYDKKRIATVKTV